MIIFHEGLPGSGKSYEALVRRIIPALQSGRVVQAYVEGLDHDKIAALAGISVERCRELLHVLTREQLDGDQIITVAQDNALLVLDEAQNFWGNRAKLSKAMVQFVTEHRHRGIDLVLMGQDLRDVHALWRRRVELKLCFLKLSALGAAKRYSVTTHRHKGQDEFERVGTVVSKYEERYFGTYKSHTSDDVNTEDYKEARAAVFGTATMRYGIPLVLVLAIWGGFKFWGFWQPETHIKTAKQTPTKATETAQAASKPAGAGQPIPQAKPDLRTVQEKRLVDLSDRYRIRLAGLVAIGGKVQGVVEWIDGGSRVMERLSLNSLRDLGVGVVVGEDFVRLGLGEWNALATMWPTEADGRVSQTRLEGMRPTSGAAPVAAPSGGLISLGDSSPRAAPAREPAAPLEVQVPRNPSRPKG